MCRDKQISDCGWGWRKLEAKRLKGTLWDN